MKYYIIAGEASGDLHGSNLMRGIYAHDKEADIRFWGGEKMDGVYKEHQNGKGLVRDYRDTAVMGYVEVLLKGAEIARNVKECKEDIESWKPDAVILIDYPGFNLKIAEFAHNKGFKVFYYIAPKVWASREGRIKKIKAWVDRLFIIFPFEVPYFQSKEIPFTYVGNPLIDAIKDSPAMQENRNEFLQRTGLPDVPWIALLAGSRKMETDSMLPTYMAFADVWHADNPDCQFVIAAAPGRSMDDYLKHISGRPYVKVVFGETYGILRHSQAAIINSGTASLEAALIGTPQIVSYKVNPITAAIARRIVKVKYASLANLILDRPAVKELLQEDFTLENLVAEMRRITEDNTYRQKMLADYSEIKEKLGGEGAYLVAGGSIVKSTSEATP